VGFLNVGMGYPDSGSFDFPGLTTSFLAAFVLITFDERRISSLLLS
jgi:hypothetical protein